MELLKIRSSWRVKRDFKESPEKALLFLATAQKQKLPPSVKFWSHFSQYFMETLRLDPSVEELREKSSTQPEKQAIRKFLQDAPFMPGSEYLNEQVLLEQWDKLTNQFRSEIGSYKGSVQEYFAGINPEAHLVGRVYFHLVENKGDNEFPFAFLATYLADVKDKEDPTHRPLSFALEEYAKDQKKMLLLLGTIKRASKESKLIKDLMDSGDIFSPLGWDSDTAHTFFKEVSLYNKAGVLCRIPNWWRAQSKGLSVQFKIGEKKSVSLWQRFSCGL